ncbi:WD40 repeat-like protein [Auriculariales sp. MPI-PUGE-AT-0066]|nr:WD40 repeat-like protein [Auriculariales sp. MPI-PUGE-AT-0066]
MRVKTLEIRWHDNKPVNSCDFQPNPAFLRRPRSGKEVQQAGYRLATAGEDNCVRVWMVHPEFAGSSEDESTKPRQPRVEYLATLSKHSSPVNVVRFSPNGDEIASAGDDGIVVIWRPSDRGQGGNLGDSDEYAKEHWRARISIVASRSSEIYDLAWSPTGEYIIVGFTDNAARIFSSANGHPVKDLLEHSHRVQGVAWDPMNEFFATQSADRSVHIHSLNFKHGQFETHAVSKNAKMQVRHTRTPSRSRRHGSVMSDAESIVGDDMAEMPPPRSRRSSFSGSQAGGASRGTSPAPVLPAVRPWMKLYGDESSNNWFRRLTFSPDGALLLTPAGQVEDTAVTPGGKSPATSESNNASGSSSVFVYTRANFTRPPVAQLPGFKKPTVAVKFSPVLYELRPHGPPVDDKIPQEIVIDKDTDMQVDVDLSGVASTSSTIIAPIPSSPMYETPPTPPPSAPPPVFALPYRMIYAVAAMDSVAIYDTQQVSPIALLSRLHYDEFTDVTWSHDGRALVLSARDGYCTVVVFDEKVALHPTQQPALQLQSIAAHSFGNHHAHLQSPQQVAHHLPQAPVSPPMSLAAPSPAHSQSSVSAMSQSQSQSMQALLPQSGSAPQLKRAGSPVVERVEEQQQQQPQQPQDGAPPPNKKRRLVLTHHGQ